MMTLTHLAISGLMTSLMAGTADPLVVSVGATAEDGAQASLDSYLMWILVSHQRGEYYFPSVASSKNVSHIEAVLTLFSLQ
jgi:hypothetical protein